MFKESYLLLVVDVVVFVLVEVTFVVRTRCAWEEKIATKRKMPRSRKVCANLLTIENIRRVHKKSRGEM